MTTEIIKLKEELNNAENDLKTQNPKTDKKGYMKAYDNVNRIKSFIRIAELSAGKTIVVKQEEVCDLYEGVTSKDIQVGIKRDPAHEKRVRATEEWQNKFDSE